MKKAFYLLTLGIFSILLTGCWNNSNNSNEIINGINTEEDTTVSQESNINDILKTIIQNRNKCDNDGQIFIDFAILWNWENDKWNTEYYLVTNWQCFYVDERWNLNNSWWFGDIPTTIELSQDENWYNLISYTEAKDWNQYLSSTEEMFSKEAFKVFQDAKFVYANDKTLLEQAEEYFWITIIPETENNFECKFCDKLRYYEPSEDEWKSNEIIYNYVSEDNWENAVYFGSDWTFKAEWRRDAWEWTRTFGQDENTIIVLNNNLEHVYHRYIVTNQTENSLNTILEIIQRR